MDSLIMGAWVSLQAGCEITRDVGGCDAAVLTMRGRGQQPFELHTQAEPLRQLVEVGSQALAEMDTLAVQAGAERAAMEQASRMQPGVSA